MEIIRKNPECISCLVKKHIDKYPENATKEQKIKYMEELLSWVYNAPHSMSAPEIVDKIYMLRKNMFGEKNDMSSVKAHFNNLMLGYEDKIKNNIEKSDNPLLCAIKYSMVGNFIDFGAMSSVDEGKLSHLIDACEDTSIDASQFKNLCCDLQSARSVVLLTDNCGEIVFDKLLIDQIKKFNPTVNITAIVRGRDVLNDATKSDAAQVKLDIVCNVIDNGTAFAGTCLDKISDAAKFAIDNANVIIAKGQGNLETLQYCGLNVYYIFMCKCNMFAKKFNKPLYSGVLINDKDL